MAFAFIIQTFDSEEPELAYYRFYSAWSKEPNATGLPSQNKEESPSSFLFESNGEKKEIVSLIVKKNHMLYSLKLKQSLIPIQNQDIKTLIKGCYTESSWKSERFTVVWEGVPGIGFSLVCEEDVNISQAQMILDLLVSEMEKYLQIVSYPLITPKTFDSVALIVDTFLPGGQLLLLNSSLIKSLEKLLESDL